jgi:hypothetical protein
MQEMNSMDSEVHNISKSTLIKYVHPSIMVFFNFFAKSQNIAFKYATKSCLVT